MSLWHGLISLDFYQDFEKHHCFLPELTISKQGGERDNDKCLNIEWGKFMQLMEGINVYDVYRRCYRQEREKRVVEI
jgi:hypothetical protein